LIVSFCLTFNIEESDESKTVSRFQVDLKRNQLEIWGRAQRKAARRRKSDCRDIFGGSNAARSNATWGIKVESCLKSLRNSTWVGQRLRL